MAYQSEIQVNQKDMGFEEEIVQVNRVSKKTKGGNRIGFSVLTVVGDRRGKVGVGLGKAPDVASAIKKGVAIAKKHAIEIPIVNGTIPFEFRIKLGAAKVILKPAPKGSGVIAGGAVRSVVSLAGIQNISSKVLGTKNQASNVYATIEALKRLAERYKRESKRQ
ncbi:MAG: 30S ribosomal protein S5 [Candidatus Levybacteria bacterium RBG_16_35_11]|nr:MAG: 30S ribosomal protein S5 [Candidatus Levybacteria bacterium RBG_16_35_11]